MFISDPRSWFLPILHFGSRVQQQHKGMGETNFIFEQVQKKIWVYRQRIIVGTVLLTQILSRSSQKFGVWIRDPEKNYPGFRIQHWITQKFCLKLPAGCSSRIRIFSHPGSKGQKAPDLGSGSTTKLATVLMQAPANHPAEQNWAPVRPLRLEESGHLLQTGRHPVYSKQVDAESTTLIVQCTVQCTPDS